MGCELPGPRERINNSGFSGDFWRFLDARSASGKLKAMPDFFHHEKSGSRSTLISCIENAKFE